VDCLKRYEKLCEPINRDMLAAVGLCIARVPPSLRWRGSTTPWRESVRRHTKVG
jgi:hypothetical protein